MTLTKKTLTIAILVASAGAVAQTQSETQQQFPRTQTQAGLCNDIKWNAEMRNMHPALIDACREVVVADGQKWARFQAKFVGVDPDGTVQFSVRDRSDRGIEEVSLQPSAGQVAYINDKPVPFTRLRTSDAINLYMPENQYGFVTAPGATPRATVVPAKAAPRITPVAESTTLAAVEPLPDRLPRTASPTSWMGLSAILLLLAGIGLTLRRVVAPRWNRRAPGGTIS